MANAKNKGTEKIKRQPAQSQLPFKSVVKKQSTKVQKKGRLSKKRIILKQVRFSLGPKIHILLQLERTVQSKAAKNTKRTGKPLKTRAKSNTLATLLIISGLVGAIFFTTDLVRQPTSFVPYSPPTIESSQISQPEDKPKTTYLLNKSVPLSLAIADIGIDTSLTSVSRKADNTMEVPKNANMPGWYRLSPTPGELGPSIIVGHVDSETGPAVFWRLRELGPGQIIKISRTDGSQARFEVVSVRQFEQNNFPTQEVYGNIDHAGLRLITCGGTFNRITRQYSHNTVVYAKLVEDPAKAEQIKKEEPFFKKPDFNVLEPWTNNQDANARVLFTQTVDSSSF